MVVHDNMVNYLSEVEDTQLPKLFNASYYWNENQIIASISFKSTSLTKEQEYTRSRVLNYISTIFDDNDDSSNLQKKNLCILSDIKNVWNEEDNTPIPVSVITEVSNVILNLTIQPRIYPTNRKSIQLQYELADRSYLEFEMFADHIVCMIVPQRKYEKAIFPSVKIGDYNEMNRILEEFYGVAKHCLG